MTVLAPSACIQLSVDGGRVIAGWCRAETNQKRGALGSERE